LCQEPATQCSEVHVVGERTNSVDLHDREPFAVARLECRVAADVDLAKIEVDLRPGCQDDVAGALTQVATLGVVQDDRMLWNYG
jgi:hypothetical protein